MSFRRLAAVSLLALLASLGARTATAQPAPPRLTLELPAGPQKATAAIDVAVSLQGLPDLAAFELEIEADPALLKLKGVSVSDRLGKSQGCDPSRGPCVLSLGPALHERVARLGAVVYGQGGPPVADGAVVVLHFQAAGTAGAVPLRFVRATVVGRAGKVATPTWKNATLLLTN